MLLRLVLTRCRIKSSLSLASLIPFPAMVLTSSPSSSSSSIRSVKGVVFLVSELIVVKASLIVTSPLIPDILRTRSPKVQFHSLFNVMCRRGKNNHAILFEITTILKERVVLGWSCGVGDS